MNFKSVNISWGFICRFDYGGDFFVVYGRNQVECLDMAVKLYKYLVKYYDLIQGI